VIALRESQDMQLLTRETAAHRQPRAASASSRAAQLPQYLTLVFTGLWTRPQRSHLRRPIPRGFRAVVSVLDFIRGVS
jgi:hypothetical protein